MPTAREIERLVKPLAVQHYKKAFLAIEAQVTQKQRKMLCAHYRAPGRTVTAARLARLVGFESYAAVNVQYGRLAHRLWDSLGLPSGMPASATRRGVWSKVLANFKHPGDEWQSTMRSKVARALEQIGWCHDRRGAALHVLVGDASGDVDLLVAAAKNRRASVLWRVPKWAHVGDAVVFYFASHGFAAKGVIGSEPLRHKSGWYKATVRDLDLFQDFVPLGFIRENYRQWRWTAYPRSYTTVYGAAAARLTELLNGYKKATEEWYSTRALNATAGAGFGDAEHSARVERAAVDAVKRKYESQGWTVESREGERRGYDLDCSRGATLLHVEVKGIKGADCGFMITNKEKRTARADPGFRLVAVTHALDARKRRLIAFSGPDLLHRFSFAPVSFVARLNSAMGKTR